MSVSGFVVVVCACVCMWRCMCLVLLCDCAMLHHLVSFFSSYNF